MQEVKCSHLWGMVNVVSGLIVMKKCFHCGKVSTCFAFHDEPPLEPCHEVGSCSTKADISALVYYAGSTRAGSTSLGPWCARC